MRKINSTLLAPIIGLLFASGLSAQVVTGNLLSNPGAEDGTGLDPGTVNGWTVGGDSIPGRDDSTFDGFTPNTGTYDFYGNHGTTGTLDQTVDLLAASLTPAQLDSGATVNFDFFEQSLDQGSAGDTGGVNLSFLDASGNVLGTATSGNIYHPGGWLEVPNTAPLPPGTRSIDYQMSFILNVGGDLDAFIDDNQLTLTLGGSSVTLPVATLSVTTPTVTVGSGEIGEFSVQLSAASASPLVINYAIKGSAINGTDYVLLSGHKKLKPGKTSKPIKIIPSGDLEGAAKKVVKITLLPGTGYTVGTTTAEKVKILPAP